jgi:DNA-binding MarR family transcriptional regulator
MNQPTPAEETAVVLNSIRRIVRLLRVSSRQAEANFKVTAAQLFVLQKVAEAPSSSLADLARRTLTDPSSVSTVVARLVRSGLVKRAQSSSDSRRAELSITPKGTKLLSRAQEPAQVQLLEALQRMPAEKLHELSSGLNNLIQQLGLSEAEAPLFFEDDRSRRKTSR